MTDGKDCTSTLWSKFSVFESHEFFKYEIHPFMCGNLLKGRKYVRRYVEVVASGRYVSIVVPLSEVLPVVLHTGVECRNSSIWRNTESSGFKFAQPT
jgi:hypothetical protein